MVTTTLIPAARNRAIWFVAIAHLYSVAALMRSPGITTTFVLFVAARLKSQLMVFAHTAGYVSENCGSAICTMVKGGADWRLSPSTSLVFDAAPNVAKLIVNAVSSVAPGKGFTVVSVGASLTLVMVIVTVATTEVNAPSLTEKVKRASPVKLVAGR